MTLLSAAKATRTLRPAGAPSPRTQNRARGLGWLLLAGLLGGCNLGTGSSGEQSGIVGTLVAKPDGSGSFFVDVNQSGGANRLRIAEMSWGRLVDVHDVDAFGQPNPEPLFQDFVINETVQTDLSDYMLETNPITQSQRLVVRRQSSDSAFLDLLRLAASNLAPVTAKDDDGTSAPPFSFIARNSVLVVRFDDLLRDTEEAEESLPETIRFMAGYPPVNIQPARMLFDPNHGGLGGAGFHSTRVLVDLTVSEGESTAVPLAINLLGLPSSLTTTDQANISLRIPTRADVGSGQFQVLRSAGGSPLATSGNEPVDFSSPTLDIVRAMRSGNANDSSNGFLTDDTAPEILAEWPSTVDRAIDDPAGVSGFDFLVDISFPTVCQGRPGVGDVISTTDGFLEVTQLGGFPVPGPGGGEVRDLKVRLLGDEAILNPDLLMGLADYRLTYDVAASAPVGCWVSFSPPAVDFPNIGVHPEARVVMKFTEPMDPASLDPFDSFVLVRGAAADTPGTTNTVIGSVERTGDLRTYNFAPSLPFAHPADVPSGGELYHIELGRTDQELTDLAGNPLVASLPDIEFTIDPMQPAENNGGFVLRFDDADEYQIGIARDLVDLRGQIVYDVDRGVIMPRPVARVSYPIDQANPVPALMANLPFFNRLGTNTPLSPLGSKMQTLWRYCDAGWIETNEAFTNLDVEGLKWSPVAGQAIAEFYTNFEIRLSHSSRLPDESTLLMPPTIFYPTSGLFDKPRAFSDNILSDPFNTPVVVHNRSLGYTVDPADLSQTLTGTAVLPFPLNRSGGAVRTYTWRDTSILAVGGQNSPGVPLDVELFVAGLGPAYGIDPTNPGFTRVYGPGQVASVGLPLLMEFRCYASDEGVGLNSFNVGLGQSPALAPPLLPAIPGMPFFRVHSTGGTDTMGNQVFVNPDLELIPGGGFNPASAPQGMRTPSADNTFYFGELDTVTRISRAHSMWFRVQEELLDGATPDYLDPVVQPSPEEQPSGTQIVVEFRGASMVGEAARAVDGARIDLYGNIENQGAQIQFLNNDGTWKSTIDQVDGSFGVQLRLTFISNVLGTQLSPELSTLAIAASGQ